MEEEMQQASYQTEVRDRRKVVVMSEKDWKKFQSEHQKLKKKVEIMLGIQDAMNEVRQIQSGKRKPRSFESLLDEL
jgi:hypothetical protein